MFCTGKQHSNVSLDCKAILQVNQHFLLVEPHLVDVQTAIRSDAFCMEPVKQTRCYGTAHQTLEFIGLIAVNDVDLQVRVVSFEGARELKRFWSQPNY